MGYPDLERARNEATALARLVEAHAGPGANLRSLRRVVDLCRDLQDVLDDEYCLAKIRAVAEYAAELFSQDEPRARGAMRGIDFLRGQIRSALELLQSRLYSLERGRRFGQHFAHAGFGAIHAAKR